MLFKTNTKGHKHPSIKLFIEQDTIGKPKKTKSVISEHIFRIKLINTSCEIVLSWMPYNTYDD